MLDEAGLRKEKNRIMRLLRGCTEERRKLMEPVAENLAWMRLKLDETREEIAGDSVACEYDNGNGQSGIHENPLFRGYENLWRAYMVGFEKLLTAIGAEGQAKIKTPASPRNVLELVRRKHEAEA